MPGVLACRWRNTARALVYLAIYLPIWTLSLHWRSWWLKIYDNVIAAKHEGPTDNKCLPVRQPGSLRKFSSALEFAVGSKQTF